MAKIKPERAAAKEEITSFAGICGHASPSGKAAADCCNFRICGDGSLEKRSGWSVKREFMDPVQAVWVGTVGGRAAASRGQRRHRLSGSGRLQQKRGDPDGCGQGRTVPALRRCALSADRIPDLGVEEQLEKDGKGSALRALVRSQLASFLVRGRQ